MKKHHVGIISDVHGQTGRYLKSLKKAEYTIQLGDLTTDLDGYQFFEDNNIDPDKHKFFGGNHDNYDLIEKSPHNLGDFGVWTIPDFGDIFYIRGGYSIDHSNRIEGLNLWATKEQLSWDKSIKALDLYKQVKPNIVISHECPLEISPHFIDNMNLAMSYGHSSPVIATRTSQILQSMADFHQPKLHVFGHYHVHRRKKINGTKYICLNMMQHFDLSGYVNDQDVF